MLPKLREFEMGKHTRLFKHFHRAKGQQPRRFSGDDIDAPLNSINDDVLAYLELSFDSTINKDYELVELLRGRNVCILKN